MILVVLTMVDDFLFMIPDDDLLDGPQNFPAIEPTQEITVSELSEEVSCRERDELVEFTPFSRSFFVRDYGQHLLYQFHHCW